MMKGNAYKMLKSLGKGAFGEVFLCEAQNPPGLVAVKILRLPDDANLRRFYREAEILHREVQNPYVVNLIDYSFDTDPPYLVMEFCGGGSLRSWVGSRPQWPRVAKVIAHAAMGLHGIHVKGGFHRDVKPDNILLVSASGDAAKLGDFGIARVPYASSSTMTRSAMGTPAYMAPELMYGAPYTASADIYSLGITAIELLTGAFDWNALQPVTLPSELYRLLLSMIDSDPGARPSAGEVAGTLQRLLHPSILTSQSAVSSSPAAPVRGSKGAGWFIGGLAALAGAAWLLSKGGSDETWWDSSVQRYRDSNGRFRSG